MKKIIYLLLLLTAFEARAQNGVVFKMKYMPGRKYTSALALGANVKITMTGNDSLINKLKSQGITMPVILNLGLNLTGDASTGKMSADNGFPLTFNYNVQDVKVNLNGNDIDPLKGKTLAIKIYAHSKPDGTIKADSSFFNDKKDTSKASASSVLNSLQNQIKFPATALKVGDTFTQDGPLNLPMGDMGASTKKTLINTVYKLVSIADGKAYFDITQTADLEITVKGANVMLTGAGAGKLVYSMKDNFPLSLNSTIAIKLNVTIAGMVIDGNADVTVSNTRTIN
jgi:hypothetical protein